MITNTCGRGEMSAITGGNKITFYNIYIYIYIYMCVCVRFVFNYSYIILYVLTYLYTLFSIQIMVTRFINIMKS